MIKLRNNVRLRSAIQMRFQSYTKSGHERRAILVTMSHPPVSNLSLNTGKVSAKLKTSKVIQVYKNGDSSLPCYYLPISLLNIFDKLLEILMYNR